MRCTGYSARIYGESAKARLGFLPWPRDLKTLVGATESQPSVVEACFVLGSLLQDLTCDATATPAHFAAVEQEIYSAVEARTKAERSKAGT